MLVWLLVNGLQGLREGWNLGERKEVWVIFLSQVGVDKNIESVIEDPQELTQAITERVTIINKQINVDLKKG